MSELGSARLLDCWLYWLLHAHEMEPGELLRLFPQEPIRQATQTITRIAQKTEDIAMYNSREKAIRDRQWALEESLKEGLLKGIAEGKAQGIAEGKAQGIAEGKAEGKAEGIAEGKAELIQTLEGLLGLPLSNKTELTAKSLEELDALSAQLQSKLRSR